MGDLWLSGDPALSPAALNLSLDQFLDDSLAPKRRLYVANSGSWVCKFFNKGVCMRGQECPYRHSRGDKPFVCKFWLRGLCKKGADVCESLHIYDLSKMPFCSFIIDYGSCHNPDCLFNHQKPKDRVQKDCIWYARGFCKMGPNCKSRHRKREMCPDYLAGFCELGPNCPKGHPKWLLPAEMDLGTPQYDSAGNLIPGSDQPRLRSLRSLIGMAMPTNSLLSGGGGARESKERRAQSIDEIQCNLCKQYGHMAGACPNAPRPAGGGGYSSSSSGGGGGGGGSVRDLSTVQCFRCGEIGHYANLCSNERREPPEGGWVLPSGVRQKDRMNMQKRARDNEGASGGRMF